MMGLLRRLAVLLGAALVATPAAAVTLDDGVVIHGKWQQGALLYGRAPAGTKVVFDGHKLNLTPYGTFVIGFDRDEKSPAVVTYTVPGHATRTWLHPVASGHWKIQRINGLSKDKVSPPASTQARIHREAQEIHAVREKQSDDLIGFTQDFIWPVVGRISSAFGNQRILDGKPRQPHYGVDIAIPSGTPVKAPASGVVSLVAHDMYFTGGTLMIDHGHGVQSVFAHLSKITVELGQHVEQGQTVALTGASGRATGPNLHWGVSWFGSRVNAAALVGPMPPKH